MNSFNGIGNLTRDPELNMTTTGKKVCRFTVAIKRVGGRESKDVADFVPCVCWDAVAENAAKFLKKGREVGINGAIRTGKYTDKEGKTHYTIEVEISKYDGLKFLGGPKTDAVSGGEAPSSTLPSVEIDETTGMAVVNTEELPF